jgi:dihydrofolate synthase/folylpolyglutamate synthase
MDYSEVLKRLFAARGRASNPTLEPMQKILTILGNPQNTFPAIHVAGTNGKGSVVTKIAAGLSHEKYKVGLYTSPHIERYTERISINGKEISEDELVSIFKPLFAFNLTFFEYTTLAAFCYFAKEKVDYVVLETGIGGRLDATNVCQSVLSVITSISLDHTAVLGATYDAIATEKAGIIKPHVPVVIGPTVPRDVIYQVAMQKHAPVFEVTGTFAHFDIENQEVARKALEILEVSSASIQKGLLAVPDGRFQVVSHEQVTVIIDVAHNPDGISKLLQRVKLIYGEKPITVVCGFSEDKDVGSCMRLLKEHVNAIFCLQADSPRAIAAKELAQLAQSDFFYEEISEGIEAACHYAKKNEQIVLICGSFFIMREVKIKLGLNGTY